MLTTKQYQAIHMVAFISQELGVDSRTFICDFKSLPDIIPLVIDNLKLQITFNKDLIEEWSRKKIAEEAFYGSFICYKNLNEEKYTDEEARNFASEWSERMFG